MAAVNESTHNSNPTPQNQTANSGISSQDISLDDLNTDQPAGGSDLPSIDLPDLPDSPGLGGNLDDALGNL